MSGRTKKTSSSLQRELEQLEATDSNVGEAAKKYDEGVRAILARKPRMTTSDEAIVTEMQPTKPCHDCPFARTAINGWLGGNTKEEWSALVQGEVLIPCHALKGPQCAGAAILRGNMCKRPRDRSLLVLPPDRDRVFSHTREFEDHHAKLPVKPSASREARQVVSVREEILTAIDEAIAPSCMTEEEALTVLSDLQDDISARADALREQIDGRDKPKTKGRGR